MTWMRINLVLIMRIIQALVATHCTVLVLYCVLAIDVHMACVRTYVLGCELEISCHM